MPITVRQPIAHLRQTQRLVGKFRRQRGGPQANSRNRTPVLISELDCGVEHGGFEPVIAVLQTQID